LAELVGDARLRYAEVSGDLGLGVPVAEWLDDLDDDALGVVAEACEVDDAVEDVARVTTGGG
jgi:hypothetical protein